MQIGHLYCDVSLPPLARVRRRFEVDTVSDVAAAVRTTLDASGIAQRLSRGSHVAIGVGSRGIAQLPVIVAAIVEWFVAQHTANRE